MRKNVSLLGGTIQSLGTRWFLTEIQSARRNLRKKDSAREGKVAEIGRVGKGRL